MHKSDNAVSPAVAVMLIVVLTVFMAGAFGIAVISMSDTTKHSPTAGISITKSGDEVKLTHFSGSSIKKEEYKIVIDSVSYDGEIDFNVGTVLKYNAENANHVAVIYTAKLKETIISEKYFGGSGLPESSINAEITGFRTTSDPSEMSDDKIFSTESKIGIIVKLIGDATVEKPSASITNHDVGNLILWEEQSDASKYVYYIEKAGNEKYYTDGMENAEVVFSDDAVANKSCYATVNIPPEADLTFEIGTYAKYITGVFTSEGGSKYVGHGIIVTITGGSRQNEVVPFNNVDGNTRLDYIIEVNLKDSDKTFKTGETKTDRNKDTLIEDYELSNKGDSKYFYIKNEADNRFSFNVEEYILKIKFNNDEIKIYTFKSNDELDTDINYHIPAWSPLYEKMWYPTGNPGSPDITYTVSAHTEENNLVRGIKVDITGGTFPAAKWGKDVYPVSMSAVLINNDGSVSQNKKGVDYKLVYGEKNEPYVSNISSGQSYVFKINNDDYLDLTNKKVKLTFTMKDLINKDSDSIKSSSYTSVSETITIPAPVYNPNVEVSIDSYNKAIEFFKLSNDKQNAVDCFSKYRGHGIILTITGVSGLNPNKKYSLNVTVNDKYIFGNGLYLQEQDEEYGEVKFGTRSGSSFSNNLIKLNDGDKSKNAVGDTYYFWIGPHTNEEAVGKFTSAKVVVNLYEDGKKINTIYDKSIDIPARDIITVNGYNEEDGRGLILTLDADLSDIVDNPKLKIDIDGKTYFSEISDGNTLKVPIDSALSGTAKVTIENTKDKYGLSENIKLYYYKSPTTGESESTNPSITIS